MRNDIGGGDFGVSIQARDINGSISFVGAGEKYTDYLENPERWPLARDWDVRASGVHAAHGASDKEDVTPYVRRDSDAQLRRYLLQASEHGGVVLVLGDSTAGKTRTAHQSLQENLPEWKIATPRSSADLARLAHVVKKCRFPCVIWLDEFQSFLGLNGLEPGLLAEFEHLCVPIVATMRTADYDSLVPSGQDTEFRDSVSPWQAGVGAQVLRSCRLVELQRIWSESELARARECDDERVVEAARRHSDFGVAEYIAAGPLLWREWRHAWRAGGELSNGHPRGAALVAAAIDLARVGISCSSETLLAQVHEYYLMSAGGPVLRPEPLHIAMAWCAKVRLGVSSLLVPDRNGTWKPFHYLLDKCQQGVGNSTIPDFLWEAALENADDEDRYRIGVNAYPEKSDIAEAAWRPLAEAGFPAAAFSLGILMLGSGRLGEAETLYREAASRNHSLAMNNLGALLVQDGRTEEAENWFRRAAECNLTEALVNLGALLRRKGDFFEAEMIYRRAIDLEQPLAWNNLGNLLSEVDRPAEAKEAYRRGVDHGDMEAAFNYGKLCVRLGENREAEQMLRMAVKSGHHLAVITLARYLDEMGCVVAAEEVLRDAMQREHAEAANELGALFVRQGRARDAQDMFRAAEKAGHASAAFNLGLSLYNEGRVGEAEEAYRRAGANGHIDATFNLGMLLRESGRTAEAEEALRQASESDHAGASYNLGFLLWHRGDVAESKKMYRRSVESGSAEASNMLGVILMNEGKTEAAEAEFRRALELGSPVAAANLGGLLRREKRLTEAEVVYRMALGSGNVSVAYNLGNLLMGEGRDREAEEAYRIAVRAGGECATDAAYNLARILAETGRFGEAQALFQRVEKIESDK